MQEILIRKSVSDIQHQFHFLKSIENSLYLKSHRSAVMALASLTGVYIVLVLFTDSKTLVSLKAVSSILILIYWIGSLVYAIWAGFRLVRRNSSIEKVIQTKLNENRDHVVSFVEERFSIRANDFKLELDWNYFKAYLESERAIFLFPEGSLYDAYSFTANEIGGQNLENLRRIVKGKLQLLETN